MNLRGRLEALETRQARQVDVRLLSLAELCREVASYPPEESFARFDTEERLALLEMVRKHVPDYGTEFLESMLAEFPESPKNGEPAHA